eukprot:2877657-Pyramimonas_sp.AAC.1
MQQTSASDYYASVSVRISSVAPLEQTTGSPCRDGPSDTNSLADLARVADRFQTSACDRRTRPMSPNRFLQLPAL